MQHVFDAVVGQTSSPDAAAFLSGSRPRQSNLTALDLDGFQRRPSTFVFPHHRLIAIAHDDR
jgi:hypothetical protein